MNAPNPSVDLERARATPCAVARTALLFPFSMSVHHRGFERREVPDRKDGTKTRRLWRRVTAAPPEGRELSSKFRALLEEQASDAPVSPWRTARYELEQWFLDGLGGPALVVRQGGETHRIEGFTLERVEAVHFSHGTGVLAFHIDWLRAVGRGNPTTERDLGEVQGALHAARHTHGGETVRGWEFGGRSEVAPEHAAALGAALHAAAHGADRSPIGATALVDWLLLMPEEKPGDATRAPASRFALHHSVVVLEEAPPDAALSPLLFQLRRGYAPTHLPPPDDSNVDRSIAPRRNRRVGVSREGVVSLSWLGQTMGSDAGVEFERNQWAGRFQGIYLWLAEHVLAEHAVLSAISERLAARVADLRSPAALADAREDLDALVHDAARHAATVHGTDCGGPSDYVEHFAALREVFAMAEQLAELRRQLDDVQRIATAAHERERDRRARRFERTLAVAGAFAIPPAIADAFTAVFDSWDGAAALLAALAYLVIAFLFCATVWRRS